MLAARMVERGLPPRRGRVRPVARRPPLRRVLRGRTRRGSGSRSPAPRASRRSPRTPTRCSRGCAPASPTCSCTSGSASSSRAVVARARAARLGRARARELGADVRLRAARLARRLRGLGVHRHHRRRQPRARRAARAFAARPRADRSAAPPTTWAASSAKRVARAEHLTRAGIADGLRRVKHTARDERLRRHADGLRRLGPRRAQGPLPGASRVEGRPQRPGRSDESPG